MDRYDEKKFDADRKWGLKSLVDTWRFGHFSSIGATPHFATSDRVNDKRSN